MHCEMSLLRFSDLWSVQLFTVINFFFHTKSGCGGMVGIHMEEVHIPTSFPASNLIEKLYVVTQSRLHFLQVVWVVYKQLQHVLLKKRRDEKLR